MHLWIIAYAGILLFLTHLSWKLYQELISPLADIRGPFIARLTRTWYFWRVTRGKFEQDNLALHRKYGSIVRVAPNQYSIDDPFSIKTIYGIGSHFTKSAWYEGWKHPSPDRWTLFPDRDIRRHAETRKRFQHLYSMTSLVNYEPFVDNCADLFIDQLSNFAKNGNVFDLSHWFQCYSFDVIGELTFGERFGFLDSGEDLEGTIEALQRSMAYSTLIGIFNEWHAPLYGLMSKLKWSGAAGRNYLMQFVQKKIQQRQIERKERKPLAQGTDNIVDFMDKVMDAHEQDPTKVSEYHIFMMGMSNIIAGSDTTSISLSAVMYYLIRNPHCLKKLRDEISDLAIKGAIGEKITFRQSQDMPYLQAVIKEALRLHSATGLPLWRVVPAGGCEISGRFFPPGTIVGVNTWVAHYNNSVFTDADCFLPERWLGENTKLKEMEAYYLPVSGVSLEQLHY